MGSKGKGCEGAAAEGRYKYDCANNRNHKEDDGFFFSYIQKQV
jgi:hypothetical protein